MITINDVSMDIEKGLEYNVDLILTALLGGQMDKKQANISIRKAVILNHIWQQNESLLNQRVVMDEKTRDERD